MLLWKIKMSLFGIRECVRRAAQKRDRGAVPFLLQEIARENVPAEIKKNIVVALGEIGDPCAVACLSKLLSLPKIRIEAAEALAKIRDDTATQSMIQVLGDVRRETKGTREVVASVLKSSNWQPTSVREAVLLCLASRNTGGIVTFGAAAVEPLIKVVSEELGNSNDVDHDRSMWIRSLGLIGDRRAVEPLITLLHSSCRFTREASAKALGQLRDGRAFDPLIEALSDSSYEVVKAAAQALGAMQRPAAFEPLVSVLKHGGSYVNETVWDALTQCAERGPEEIMQVLLATLPPQSLIDIVSSIGQGHLLPNDILSSALLGGYETQSRVATKAIQQKGMGALPLLPVLITHTRGLPVSQREECMKAIAAIGSLSDDVVNLILDTLNAAVPEVNKVYLECAKRGVIGSFSREIKPHVYKFAEEMNVAKEACRALRRLKPEPSVLSQLYRILANWEWAPNQVVTHSLGLSVGDEKYTIPQYFESWL